MGSELAAPGLSSTGSIVLMGVVALWHVGSPGSGVEPVSPALAGGIITTEFYFFGLQNLTADGDCSHEIKRCLLLGRKVMTNLDSILKSRDITLPTKVHLVKAMYGCESWTIKKAKHQRIDAFELCCWRRL